MGMYRNYTTTFASVGAVLLEQELQVPARGWIRRARALVTAGTAINTVQLAFRTATGGAGQTTALAYGLTANELDSEEAGIYYELTPSTIGGFASGFGQAFIAVAVDDATLDHAISVLFNIESAVGNNPGAI